MNAESLGLILAAVDELEAIAIDIPPSVGVLDFDGASVLISVAKVFRNEIVVPPLLAYIREIPISDELALADAGLLLRRLVRRTRLQQAQQECNMEEVFLHKLAGHEARRPKRAPHWI